MNPVAQRTPRASVRRFADVSSVAETLTVIPGGKSDDRYEETADRSRRILNVTVAALSLILIAPVVVLIALLIMLSSPGPVLYTQTRVGVNRRRASSTDGRRRVDFGGKLFKMYKFRTMYVGADSRGEVWASPDDPRVTPLGRILRKYRLDELPQLFNVLRGDMNIVGPRPEQPKIFSNLRGSIAEYCERQRVLPGITGLAQVSQHYDRSIEDVHRKLRFDLEYISACSIQQDVKVLFQTIPVVIFQRGAW